MPNLRYKMANGTTQNRFCDLYRGVDFNGFNHEIFLANPSNWGAILLIRTGPAEYSTKMVTSLKNMGCYRMMGGKLVHVASGQPVEVPEEQDYYRLAQIPYCPPERRR